MILYPPHAPFWRRSPLLQSLRWPESHVVLDLSIFHLETVRLLQPQTIFDLAYINPSPSRYKTPLHICQIITASAPWLFFAQSKILIQTMGDQLKLRTK
jgi:hypothetical protein